MHDVAATGRTAARLGIVMLEQDHLKRGVHRFDGTERTGIGVMPEGFFECPRSWGTPVTYTVADGAVPTRIVDGDPAALAALDSSVRELAASCDLVITACGFFHLGWRNLTAPADASVVLSSLDLLSVAERMTTGDVLVVTWNAPALLAAVAGSEIAGRLRMLEMRSIPEWTELERADFVARGRWSLHALATSFETALRTTNLTEVRLVVIECALIPQYRAIIRRFTTAPIIDIATLAKTLLA